MRNAAVALLTLAVAVPCSAGEQHIVTVHGRPRILDVPPPLVSVPYVDIYAGTYTWTEQVLNPGIGSQVVMQGSCHQNIRLTFEEAAALSQALQDWMMFPDEEMLLWEKTLNVQAPNQAKPSLAERPSPR